MIAETVVLGWPGGDDLSHGASLPTDPCDPSDPGWPDEEALRSADQVPSDVVLRVVGPDGLPGQWVDAGLSAMSSEQNRVAWQHCRWVLAASRAVAGTSERVCDRPRAGKIVAASLGWSEGYADAGTTDIGDEAEDRGVGDSDASTPDADEPPPF